MATKFISERNLKFLLYEVFDAESLLNYPRYADHSKEVFNMVLDTAMKMAKDLFRPISSEMDKEGPQYIEGNVKVHPEVRNILKAAGSGGWIGASLPYECGGQQLPEMIGMAAPTAIFSAANYSATVFHILTNGAAGLISSYGAQEMKDLYLPKMLAGEWQGTMALTEPQAGSSLADITLTGSPTDQGYYLMKGQKIFISAGDHDGTDNVIHLAIGRIKGSPAGVKGISLFVVPQKRVESEGELKFNDVNCAGIYHKLGYRGAPITQLAFGENNDCRGWLLGEANKGLAMMFQMMNSSRIEVGLGAAGISSSAYFASLSYAGERTQGRKIDSKDPLLPQIPIIEHPDIKRMLLFQKAIVEGSLSLLMQCSFYHDMKKVTGSEEREKYDLLLDLLTPVAKSYPSEMGVLSCSQAIQILGGYGYCDEFPLEQYYRDVRIHPIHEGTTGIQAIDLLGRKVSMKDGKARTLFLAEIRKAVQLAQEYPELATFGESLGEAADSLEKVTAYLFSIAAEGKQDLFLADATLYLEFFGIITIAWQWLLQAMAACRALTESENAPADINFYQGKIHTCRYFFGYELPKTQGLVTKLFNSDGLTLKMKSEYFGE